MTKAPRELDGDDLVLSHFSLEREHPIEDRIAAAADAGFSGIGLFAGEFARLRSRGFTLDDLAGLLDASGICLADIEVLSGWAVRRASDAYVEFENLVWELVDHFECRYVQAIGPYEGTLDDAARAFASLCDRAGDHGAVVGLEFLPFTNLRDAHDTLRIVEAAGRPNGGVCVDIWHHARGANDIEMIRAIPGELVTGIQMSDGTLQPQIPEYKDDCLRNRLPPGAGEFGAVEFVCELLDLGVDVPWQMEVCDDDAWGRPASAHTRRIADAMRRVLTTARSTNRG